MQLLMLQSTMLRNDDQVIIIIMPCPLNAPGGYLTVAAMMKLLPTLSGASDATRLENLEHMDAILASGGCEHHVVASTSFHLAGRYLASTLLVSGGAASTSRAGLMDMEMEGC